MNPSRVLARIEALGAKVDVRGDRLRMLAPRGAISERDLADLASCKPDLVCMLRDRERRRRASQDGLDRFLADCSIPFAICHSRALDRDFVLARDPAALHALVEEHRHLPALYFSDAEHVATLGREGLRVLLDLRERFGPEVALREIRAPGTLK